MLLNDGGRLHHHDHLQESRPQSIEPDPNQAINPKNRGASGLPAAQDGELVAERYDLELQFDAAAKPTGEP
jgi:hypothetical protein